MLHKPVYGQRIQTRMLSFMKKAKNRAISDDLPSNHFITYLLFLSFIRHFACKFSPTQSVLALVCLFTSHNFHTKQAISLVSSGHVQPRTCYSHMTPNTCSIQSLIVGLHVLTRSTVRKDKLTDSSRNLRRLLKIKHVLYFPVCQFNTLNYVIVKEAFVYALPALYDYILNYLLKPFQS